MAPVEVIFPGVKASFAPVEERPYRAYDNIFFDSRTPGSFS